MAELIIDRNYYNKLDIEGFSKMMSSPSYSYKFYWLEAIVQLISACILHSLAVANAF